MPRGWAIEEIEEDETKKGPRGWAVEEEVEEEDDKDIPPLGESILRTVGQSVLPVGDEAYAGARSLYEKATGKLQGKDLLERYNELWNQEQKEIDKLYEKRPALAYGGDIAGAFVPIFGQVGKGAKGLKYLKGVAGQAALNSLLASKRESLGSTAEDVGTGIAFGKGLEFLGKHAKEIPYGLAQHFLDADKSALKTYAKMKDKFPKSTTIENLSRRVAEEDVPKLREKSKLYKSEAKKSLGEKGLAPKKDISNILQRRIDEVKDLIGNVEDMGSLSGAIKELKKAQKGYLPKKKVSGILNKKGIPYESSDDELTDLLRMEFTAKELENLVKSSYGLGRVPPDAASIMAAKKDISDYLKKNPDFKREMAKSHELMKLLDDIEHLGVRVKSPKNIKDKPFKNILSSIGKATDDEAKKAEEIFKRIDKELGTNLVDEAKYLYAKKVLGRDTTQGSRKVNMYREMLGSIPYLGPFSGLAGAMIDKLGGEISTKAIDLVAELSKIKDRGPSGSRMALKLIQKAVDNGTIEARLAKNLIRELNTTYTWEE